MTDREIYRYWFSKTGFDIRHLKPGKWEILKAYIIKHNISSVLEFGSGVSTLLFDKLGLNILSIETNYDYMNTVRSLCSFRVSFKFWNNRSVTINTSYDLTLVDGALPRTQQVKKAIKYSKVIVIDDYEGDSDPLNHLLSKYKCVDDQSTVLAIFEKDN